MLFWSLLLAAYGFVLRLRYKTDPRLFAYASVVVAGCTDLLLIAAEFRRASLRHHAGLDSCRWQRLEPTAAISRDGDPSAYALFGIRWIHRAFAFALGALIMRYPGEKWIHITRRWTMVTWGFLMCGIFLGAHWAYSVLGWGGYWGWDPGGKRFAHAVAGRHRISAFRDDAGKTRHVEDVEHVAGLCHFLAGDSWNVSHPQRNYQFGPRLCAILHRGLVRLVSLDHLLTFVFFFFKNKSHLRSEHKLESLVSRESSFLFNNLLLLLLAFTVLWGTWFPKISELVQGNKVTVGAPFYNRVAIPVALLLLILTAVGPLLAWRKTSIESLKRNFLWPTIGAIAVAIFLMVTPQSWGSAFGLKPWKDIAYFYSLMAIVLSVLVTAHRCQ